MPAYHSSFNEDGQRSIGSLALLPLNTQFKGPAPRGEGANDIIDETLRFFKANVFFRNYEVKGNADRLLVYMTLYTTQCLEKLQKCSSKNDGLKALNSLAMESFALPGEGRFQLNALYTAPKDRSESDQMRQYLLQCRQELGVRICELVFKNGDKPDKWWMCFVRRKFLNKSL